MSYTYTLYKTVAELPEEWDLLAGNIFLSRNYLSVLEQSAPLNMACRFIGLFDQGQLIGIALAQFLDAHQLTSFGERDQCFKTEIRKFLFKKLSARVLLIGNNMLTGQNAFALSEKADMDKVAESLKEVLKDLQKEFKAQGKKIHITVLKDFSKSTIKPLAQEFRKSYQFSVQPNMVLSIEESWKEEQHYLDALSKKYRDQYKRARKKAAGLESRELSLAEIIHFEERIYALYFQVAKNAPFNTFLLAKNHFRVLKEMLQDKFLLYGYFFKDQLIGFSTMIQNGDAIDTYFLGYDEAFQKEQMLYLNMLYDMLAYAIKHEFKELIFGRTALEIKSSVGAKPVKMYGLLTHRNALLQKNMHCFFDYLEPEVDWKERNPFKEAASVAALQMQ
ncbi:GNAT family N-acetyltransferase [Taibaiella sp. KBW10]|uniref:GNAT family N-acetyltransferase n=1 Tax=Taibaiella sp. KBW10 TaxID=2153357 RepID=UPI0018F584BA|nr:GNAT family N-acetyltransferase [Taibaiella sp. KBW10]